ncbi:MAG: hypothetical protein QNK04_32350 [Myxococcota bacterium]|nr:hypothetical protein [Myxococcota bacterium]
MARSKIPDPLERRHLVERGIPPAQAERVAEAYLEQGRTVEAIDFLAKVGAEEAFGRLRREAVESGDFFLLRSIGHATGEAPQREEWAELARAAEAAGKLRYAEDARRQAERGEE